MVTPGAATAEAGQRGARRRRSGRMAWGGEVSPGAELATAASGCWCTGCAGPGGCCRASTRAGWRPGWRRSSRPWPAAAATCLVTVGLAPDQASSGRPSPASRSMSLERAERTGPTVVGGVRAEHEGEAGDALDQQLEHHVGLVDADLGPGPRAVVHLDHDRRVGGHARIGHGQAGQRVRRPGGTVVVGAAVGRRGRAAPAGPPATRPPWPSRRRPAGRHARPPSAGRQRSGGTRDTPAP